MSLINGIRLSRFPGPLNAWWNFRRKRFWLVVVLLSYTLAGFFLLPWIVDRQLHGFVEDELQLELQLDKVYFNPWTLTAELRDFSINSPGNDDADNPLVGFDLFHINVQTSSLFRWALTFKEIRLEYPSSNLLIHEDGSINLSQLVPPADEPANGKEEAEEETTEEGGALPRLLIHTLVIQEAELDFTDASRPTPFNTHIGPLDISLNELNTLPERNGEYAISLIAGDSRIDWQGTLTLNPVASRGHLSAGGGYMQLAHQYLQDQLNFNLTNGTLSLELNYDMAVEDAEGLTASINDAALNISNLRINQAGVNGEPVEIVHLPQLQVADIDYQWPTNTLGINRVSLDNAELEAWLGPEGAINFAGLMEPAPADEDEPPATDAPPFTVTLNNFSINNLSADFTDHSVSDDARAAVRELDFTLTDISNQADARFPLDLSLSLAEGGLLTATGNISVLPDVILELDTTAEAIPLSPAQPWVSTFVRLNILDGALNHQLSINHNPGQPLHLTGTASVNQLQVGRQGVEEYLSGWENFNIDQLDMNLAERRLQISEILLQSLYGRILINEDGTTNLQDILVPRESETDKPETAASDNPFAVSISRIRLENASTDFSDLSLPLPFATHIANLSGDIDNLSTTSTEPAQIDLQGDVGEFGLTQIQGQLLPSDPTALLDMNVLFRNVEMSDATPYTVEFVGREIDSGKLDLDLQYLIENGQLQGQNSVLIDELTLGDRVDSPNAMNLPLGLAVALLKKPDGTIDIDLEVSGDVNDPSFSVGAVIWDAFVNLITRAATAPFRLLGGLVGAGDEDIGEIQFRPGESTLAPPEREKLTKLSEALVQRPELDVLVPGVLSSEVDAQAIREQLLEQQIQMRLAEEGNTDDLLSERRRRVLEDMAEETLDLDLDLLEEQYQRPLNPQEPEGDTALDESAYVADIEQQLTNNEAVGMEDLQALAAERANAIQAALLLSSELGEDRVSVSGETEENALNDAGRIPLELELAAE